MHCKRFIFAMYRSSIYLNVYRGSTPNASFVVGVKTYKGIKMFYICLLFETVAFGLKTHEDKCEIMSFYSSNG